MANPNYAAQQIKNEIAKDYVKGLLNPTYIIEKFLKTVDLTRGGFVPFKLFPRQREIVFAYDNNRHNIVTKPRQTGVSTTTAAYLAVKAAYAKKEKPEVIMIIANKFASAKKFLGLIRQFLGQLPRWIWGEGYDDNKETEGFIAGKGSTETLTLCNGTIVKAVATSPDALRGWTPTYLVIDEAAYVETFAKELYTASMASLITGGKMIIISTPNGFDELYYKVYAGAVSGENGFNLVSLKWYEDPRYNIGLMWEKQNEHGEIEKVKETEFTFDSFSKMEKAGYRPMSSWYMEMCGMLNNDKIAIARELDVKFEGSAGNVVEYEWIDFHEKNNVVEPIKKTDIEDRLWIYEEVIAGHNYIMGVDVSSGNADDFSSIIVIDTITGNQVVEYKAKVRPEYLAEIVYRLGMQYDALTIIDTTGGYGDICVLELQRKDYKYLYYSKGGNDYLKKKQKNKNNSSQMVAGLKIGSKRPQIIGKLTQYIESNDLKIRSKRFISELKTFVWINGRPDHMAGFNDDIIFAAAVALWVLETEFKALEKAKEKTKTILDVLGDGGERNKREKVRLQTKEYGGIYKEKDKSRFTSSQDPTGKYSWVLW